MKLQAAEERERERETKRCRESLERMSCPWRWRHAKQNASKIAERERERDRETKRDRERFP
jgi:hypothetical protein